MRCKIITLFFNNVDYLRIYVFSALGICKEKLLKRLLVKVISMHFYMLFEKCVRIEMKGFFTRNKYLPEFFRVFLSFKIFSHFLTILDLSCK